LITLAAIEALSLSECFIILQHEAKLVRAPKHIWCDSRQCHHDFGYHLKSLLLFPDYSYTAVCYLGVFLMMSYLFGKGMIVNQSRQILFRPGGKKGNLKT